MSKTLNSVFRFKFSWFSQWCLFFVNLSDFSRIDTLHNRNRNYHRKWCYKNHRKMGKKSFSCQYTKFFRIITNTIVVPLGDVSSVLCTSLAFRWVLVIYYVVTRFCDCFWDDYCFSKNTYAENAWYVQFIVFPPPNVFIFSDTKFLFV